ncbi:hypothetical protein EJ08DRAFT_649065, partial [Tothia fuscella]
MKDSPSRERPLNTEAGEAVAADQPTNPGERIRLHITPFNEALLKTFVPASIQSVATGISYHTLETFPERSFGYIELPKMEAQKLKKKFNGAILKGSKVRVEEARPERKRKAVEEENAEGDEPRKHKKKVKKEKGEIVGVQLPEGRSVKRGWTEPTTNPQPKEKKDKKEKPSKKDKTSKREPSKYTTEPENLFRTELPPNVASKADEKKKKKKKQGEKATVVHEFEQTVKHASFLKSGKVDGEGKVASEFVEGKGWVDGEGNVVEEEPEKQREKRERKARKEEKRAKNARKAEKEAQSEALTVAGAGEEAAEEREEPSTDTPDVTVDQADKLSEPPAKSDPTPVTQPKPIHPLEALYKRPKPTSLDSPTRPTPIKTSFNFFGTTEGDEEASPKETTPSDIKDTITTDHLPQTPFTERDLEWRSSRSAAPTPDTAAIGKKFSFSLGAIGEGEESDEEGEDDKDVKSMDGDGDGDVDMEEMSGLGISTTGLAAQKTDKKPEGEKVESEFAKWFWENRGDNNRAWKKRRREALKVKRKRENRRLNRRIV